MAGSKTRQLVVFAAGSLTGVFTELEHRYSLRTDVSFRNEFGPAGLLSERLKNGEYADVYASADVEHPDALYREGVAGKSVVLVRNDLCALTRADSAVTPKNLLTAMLDPNTKIATSTPHADPAGDYAFAMFAKADREANGARKALERKAHILVGGRQSGKPTDGQSPVKLHLERGDADIFIGYCSRRTVAPDSALRTVPMPPELTTRADYAIAILSQSKAPRASDGFIRFLLSGEGQAVFSAYGFIPVVGPQEKAR